MTQYSIPKSLISKFVQVAASNFQGPGHVETLAYLAGYKENETLFATHLVFPQQNGTSTKVDDQGNFIQYCSVQVNVLKD